MQSQEKSAYTSLRDNGRDNEAFHSAVGSVEVWEDTVYLKAPATSTFVLTLPKAVDCPNFTYTIKVVELAGSGDVTVNDGLAAAIKTGMDAVSDYIVVKSNGVSFDLITDGVA